MHDRRDLERVLWRSRRGMLELDLLLVDFARRRYPHLDDVQQDAFRELLREDDWVLLDWLRGRVVPEPRFARIVATVVAFNGSPQPGSARGLPLARKSPQPGSARGLPLARKSPQRGSARGLPLARKSPQPGSARGLPLARKSPQPGSARGLPLAREKPVMDPHHDDTEMLWTPGWEWLTAVVAIHALVAVPWFHFLGVWPLLVVGVSLLYHVRVFARGEVWRFALVAETAVLFAPDGNPAKLRGGPWMTANWVVVRTSRRVLMLRSVRYDADRFARLRRALLGHAGNG